MRKVLLLALVGLMCSLQSIAQTTFPTNGTRENFKETLIIKAKTIFLTPYSKLDDGYIMVRDGRVIKSGSQRSMPSNGIVVDYSELTIYPGFIDLWSGAGQPSTVAKKWNPRPQINSSKQGPYYWNEAVKPEQQGIDQFLLDEKAVKEYTAKGVTTLLSHKMDGIVRGSGVVSQLSTNSHKAIVDPTNGLFFSYSKGSSRQSYPSSLMGSIALLKQVFADAVWYANPKNRDHENQSLAAFNSLKQEQWLFEAGDAQTMLRTLQLAKAQQVQPLMYGGTDAYKWIDELKTNKANIILPLEFPKAYDITQPQEAELLTLQDLKNWELTPYNTSYMESNSIPFVLSSNGIKANVFLKNLTKAAAKGTSESELLAALTTRPANWIGLGSELGSLTPGKRANFIVVDGNLFQDGTLMETWVGGEQHRIENLENRSQQKGDYQLTFSDRSFEAKLNNKALTVTVIEGEDTNKVVGKLKWKDGNWSTQLADFSDYEGISLVASSPTTKGYTLAWRTPNGDNLQAQLIFTKSGSENKKNEEKEVAHHYPERTYLPFLNTSPTPNQFIIQNATVWTNEQSGILENTDVRVSNGNIVEIGKNLATRGYTIYDGTGKHLTSGIIDEHSHIAISRGVNEGGQAVSAEVSIADVVNAEDINIYRQLAGGVTAAQLLHGSANPIGGQSALIKLRYGKSAEEMKIKGADGFIKFALGENVKQSNWGSYNTVRFPQTRMGVEQVFVDAFNAARSYEKQHRAYQLLPMWKKRLTPAPRVDYELEVVLEILKKERFVTCHSYIQSEINMLMKVAEQFGFNINTFTHILEGYKVADKMVEHGVAGSTFSDWWAYKYEVNDAIPYNGAIMHQEGVLTGFNSDDAEMGRRLNQEAGKAVKYGGVSQEEAWKFVTLNPAKMLHLDDRMGSIRAGKDADLVLWSDNPLSVYAKAEMTFVDGKKLFDLATDAALQQELKEEKNSIIQDMLGAKKKGEPTQAVSTPKQKHYHCDTLGE